MPRTPITFMYTMQQCSAYGGPDNPTTSGDCQQELVWEPSLIPALSNESYGLSDYTLGMPWDEYDPALATCDYTRDSENTLPSTVQCMPAASIRDVPIPCDSRSTDMSITAPLFPTVASDPGGERLSPWRSLYNCDPPMGPRACLPQSHRAPRRAVGSDPTRLEVGSQAQTEASRRRRNSSCSSHPAFVCMFCGKNFTRKMNLDDHTRRHQNLRRYNCNKSGCQSRFNTKNDLARHAKLVHAASHQDRN